MERLGPKVIQQILQDLPSKSNLLNARLVQHSLAETGKEVLFHTVEILPSHRSLSHFLELSRQTNLAHHVKKVIVTLDDLQRLLWEPFTKKLELENTCPQAEKETPNGNSTTIFNTLLHEMNDIYTSPEFIALTTAAFSHLPQLDTVVIRHLSRDLQPCMSELGKLYLSTPPVSDINRTCWSEMDRACYIDDEPDFAFTAVINAVYLADMKLSSIQTMSCINQVLFENNPELFRRTTSVFRNCRFSICTFTSTMG